jgi:hypothetical protein
MEEGSSWIRTVLANCVNGGDLEGLKLLITVDNVNTQLYNDYTAVEVCCQYDNLECQYDNLECVKWLVEDMNADLRSSLYYCMFSRNKACADYILNAGADVNQRHKLGRTAIYVANIDYTRILLEANANVHVIDDEGYTPLGHAFHNYNIHHYSKESARIYLLMQYGGKIKDVKLSYVPASDRLERRLTLPDWMIAYQQALDDKHRKRQAEIGRAFLCVSRKKKVPKDLARDVVKRMILPNEDYFYESVTKKSRAEFE